MSECRQAWRGMPFPPQNCPFPWGICAHVICGSLNPPDWASQMTSHSGRFCTAHDRKSLYFTMGTPFPKIAPSNGGSGRHLILDSLAPSKPTTQMVSRSVQPFCTDDRSVRILSIGQTDHATRSVTTGRIYVRSTAMRPNNTKIHNAHTNRSSDMKRIKTTDTCSTLYLSCHSLYILNIHETINNCVSNNLIEQLRML